MGCIHTIKYHSSIQNKEVLPFATTWMDFEGIILSEISQAEKDKYHTISITCRTFFFLNSKERNQLTEKEIRFVATTFGDRRRNGMVVRR